MGRYHLAKLGIIAAALLLAAHSGLGHTGPSTPISGHGLYSAPAQLQTAAWHLTSSAGNAILCLVSRSYHVLLQTP